MGKCAGQVVTIVVLALAFATRLETESGSDLLRRQCRLQVGMTVEESVQTLSPCARYQTGCAGAWGWLMGDYIDREHSVSLHLDYKRSLGAMRLAKWRIYREN